MKTYVICVGIVKFNERILILKRIRNKRFSPNEWEFVSGFIKEHENAEDCVLREVKEETNLKGKIVKSGQVFETEDKYGRWIIIPFLITVKSDKVKIDIKEHSEYKWINPDRIDNFKTVADLKKDLKRVGLL
ncbi:NUDIX hydrolase [Candidatus Woesearchaeota archaeon]|nr:NUDIX hydrolase [Candidatus Woesearchaeota archaeon]